MRIAYTRFFNRKRDAKAQARHLTLEHGTKFRVVYRLAMNCYEVRKVRGT